MRIARSLVPVTLALTAVAAPVAAQSSAPPAIRAAAQRAAGSYPLDTAYLFGRDSLVLVFRDSSLTPSASRGGTWMFGPPTTKAEDDGCPPQKVLGRRIARAAWTTMGRPRQLRHVEVRVHGPETPDPTDENATLSTSWSLYYPRFQLDGPWVGDQPAGAKAPRGR